MNGSVKINIEAMLRTISRTKEFMDSFDVDSHGKKQLVWSWRKFKKIECVVYSDVPFWYQYKSSLNNHLKELKATILNAKYSGDEVWMSKISYTNLVMLSNGNKDANPIFIMNY